MNDYERRCRVLLRAYPPRYRASRSEEVLGTLLDCAAPGQRTPTAGQAWDVLRGGMRARFRDRPPLPHWLAYRLFEKRVPYPNRFWARDDQMGRLLYLRQGLSNLVIFWVIMLTVPTLAWTFEEMSPQFMLLPVDYGWLALFSLIAIAVPLPWGVARSRHRMLLKHGFTHDGTDIDTLPPVQASPPLVG